MVYKKSMVNKKNPGRSNLKKPHPMPRFLIACSPAENILYSLHRSRAQLNIYSFKHSSLIINIGKNTYINADLQKIIPVSWRMTTGRTMRNRSFPWTVPGEQSIPLSKASLPASVRRKSTLFHILKKTNKGKHFPGTTYTDSDIVVSESWVIAM